MSEVTLPERVEPSDVVVTPRRLPRLHPAFSRIVTAERAAEALKRFIDRNFNRKNAMMPRFCIPVEPDDDDMVLSDYVDQAEMRTQLLREIRDAFNGLAGPGEWMPLIERANALLDE